MNDRIEELARQAGMVRGGYANTPDKIMTWRESFDNPGSLGRFAELIVKEMCDMMEQTEDDAYSLEPSERPTEYIQFLYDWRTRFEKHFGVEE
jgi:hypothetical protein